VKWIERRNMGCGDFFGIDLMAKKRGAAGITTAAPHVADQLGQGG
jgi:hypothetical protein